MILGLFFVCADMLFAETHQLNRPDQSNVVTITDCNGRTVTVATPVKRIAFSIFSTAEALKIVGAWDLVVGIDGYTFDNIIFDNLDALPRISRNGYDLNYEKLFELNIDLLLTAEIAASGLDQMLSRLEPSIPVAVLNFGDPSRFDESLKKLGILLGKEKAAEEYLDWYHGVIDQIAQRTSTLKKEALTRYFQTSTYAGNITTFSDAKAGMPFRNKLTGSVNIAAHLPSINGWVQFVKPEWIVMQPIDVIVNFDYFSDGYGVGVTDDTAVKLHRETIIRNPVYANTEAVKANRLYMIMGICWGTPRNIVGFSYMAKWFHPELFSDFDPEKIHQEYLTRFMKIECELNEQGVFVYPK